jgi:phenylpyruvate tautomerase PptA (4-oxalocrotonate tautomerase family)
MPWANITISESCSPERQEQVKAGLAKIFAELMNKQEQGLVVTFTPTCGFFRGGIACQDAAMVDVRYIGEFGLSVKQSLTRQVANLLAKELGADPLKVVVVMSEVKSENWGRKAGDYS